MRGLRNRIAALPVIASAICFGCGYSQDAWDQKVRETEELREKLDGEKSSRAKAEADYADALAEIEALRNQLAERTSNLDSLGADLDAQKQALKEYEGRLRYLEEIRLKFERLQEKLAKLTRLGLKVEVRDNRMVIQLPGDVLFDSGKDRLRKEGEDIVLQVAQIIAEDEELRTRQFQVAGHTDDRALRGGYFGDNWGLSALRARSVLVLLTTPVRDGGGGLAPRNWSAAGYGSTAPIAENTTEEGRARNRRVELVVQPNVEEMIDIRSLTAPNPDAEK